MTTLKLAAAIAVFSMIPALAGAKQPNTQWKIESFRLYTYDANGNTSDYRYTKTISAKRHSHRKPVEASGGGVIRSKKTGATARVGAAYAAQFQAYIDELEQNGAEVRFIGGIRRGKCWSGGMHPCGKAIDVCQLSRGRVDSRCHLPGRTQIAAIAARHGLFEGGQWCHSDYGHAQVGVSAAACGSTSTMTAKRKYRHKHRYAAAPEQPAPTYNPSNY